jgi:hypothetical protein
MVENEVRNECSVWLRSNEGGLILALNHARSK